MHIAKVPTHTTLRSRTLTAALAWLSGTAGLGPVPVSVTWRRREIPTLLSSDLRRATTGLAKCLMAGEAPGASSCCYGHGLRPDCQADLMPVPRKLPSQNSKQKNMAPRSDGSSSPFQPLSKGSQPVVQHQGTRAVRSTVSALTSCLACLRASLLITKEMRHGDCKPQNMTPDPMPRWIDPSMDRHLMILHANETLRAEA